MGLGTILFYIFLVMFFLVCVLLVLVILAQEGKGGGLSGLAGSSALGETFGFGDAGNAMRRWTRNVAIVFFVMAIILTFWGEHQTSAVTKKFLAGGEAPATQAQPLQPIAPGSPETPTEGATPSEQSPATAEPVAVTEPSVTPETAATPESAATPEPAAAPEPAATPDPGAAEAVTPPAVPQAPTGQAPETTTTP